MSKGLNLAQLQAVHYTQGACLVLAGAGSGKTRVITHKIAHLIDAHGLAPQRIAAITFTNKAAAEMRERAAGLIGRRAKDLLLCTFHALGVRLLRADGQRLGLKPQFSILDSDDVLSILKDAAGGSTDAATARQWQWALSRWKNMGLNAAQALAQAKNEEEHQLARIMARYEERLAAYQSVDFDDLIGLPLKLLREHPEVREKWQTQLGYVLVDEYQDTNATQYELLKLLVGARGHFTAVGDDDQSIYGWRGATLDNLKRLPQDFPQLKVIKLEQNYRSTSAILRAANNVIGPNPKLFPKTLFSELGEGEPVRVIDADNEEHEAERAVARIQSLRAASNPPPAWRDFAILYRANHQAKPFEKALRRANIPYKVSGGTGFFDRAEIRDLCAWFRLWSNNDDDPAFLRAITSPRRGIGPQTLAQLGQFAGQHKQSLFGALFNAMLPAAVPRRALDGLHEFGRCVNDLEYRARHTLGAEAARAFLADWLQEIGYEKHLYESEDSDKVAAARWSNVLEFCDWMAQRAGGQADDAAGGVVTTQAKSLLEVAQTIALLSTIADREQDQDCVTLSTLHAAKGLEWPHVMLVGVTEGMLPFQPGQADDGEGATRTPSADELQRLQEERRLMYVGITRAQRTLAVSWSKRRKKGREMVPTRPSRFIAEMALQAGSTREDPRAKLKALRAEFAAKAQPQTGQTASASAGTQVP
ncbi:ATP-dependent helicase [Extensimonas vulgaris]|uniref:ATP-dependent DNA helicase Rep n=1 Tax=Extensimonas vulgaris TaxID=1031594 RepID=A0A369ANX9_9BURK|nr:UvrD-helicase domain-containing protein [Extensimonas vulgaris]RCX10815.1 ATP-dependent DNA helicase Rep [Extensimonas vulgaris]TWI41487.1 ATP-dependent DNA helicase Rep [Extensimonas vulgaris]TXD16917.1 AAA family ATPase [Extensimonas vulgaris]